MVKIMKVCQSIRKGEYIGIIGRSQDIEVYPDTGQLHRDIWGEFYAIYYKGFVVHHDGVDWTEKPTSEEIEAVDIYMLSRYDMDIKRHTQWGNPL